MNVLALVSSDNSDAPEIARRAPIVVPCGLCGGRACELALPADLPDAGFIRGPVLMYVLTAHGKDAAKAAQQFFADPLGMWREYANEVSRYFGIRCARCATVTRSVE